MISFLFRLLVIVATNAFLDSALRLLSPTFRYRNKIMHGALLLPYFFLVHPNGAMATTHKECIEKVSPDLVKLVGSKFPELRIPQLTDLDKQSIKFDLKNGGDGCYVVAAGDFDGDNQQDIAMILMTTSKDVHLMVALRRGNSWKIHQLPTFCETIQFCYVEPENAGTYIRTPAAEGPLTRKNERSKLSSRHMSVRSGTLESTGIVYVYSKGYWHYVWVDD